MFAVSYRATEEGAKLRLAQRLDVERKARIRAQKSAWEAQMKLGEVRAQIAEEAATRSREAAEIRRATGVPYQHSYADLERRTCRLFKLTKRELLSNRRHRDVVFARHFLMYWACRLTKLSLPRIGRLMSNRDHTTILHGKRAYVERRGTMDRYLRQAR